ncbi:hypothetical protein AMECASPLE_013708 [Ameca splendens]|uniref:Uncharacterized protein n=1 Tax=Ameca splendens TaxID=208324 RepID=A0ABV0Z089_9TELE
MATKRGLLGSNSRGGTSAEIQSTVVVLLFNHFALKQEPLSQVYTTKLTVCVHTARKNTVKTHLAVLEGTDGSCRAVSEFYVKNRDVTAGIQFTAGQSVTLILPQSRHRATVLPSRSELLRTKAVRYDIKRANIGQTDPKEDLH